MTSPNAPWPARFRAYIDERFPLGAYLPLIVLLTLVLDAAGQALASTGAITVDLRLPVGMALLTLIFFHLRLFDEFKDYQLDLQIHPDRVVSRGIVTLRQLRPVVAVVIALELVLALSLGPVVFTRYLLVLVFSLLMFKEFFVGPWLRRDMVVYAVTHQPIVLLIGWTGLGLHARFSLVEHLNDLTLLGVALLGSSLAFELSRKVHDPEGEPPREATYSSYFGWRPLAWLVAALVLAAALVLVRLALSLQLPAWFAVVIGLLTALVIVQALRTGYVPTAKRVGSFNTLAGGFMLAWYLLLALAIGLARGLTVDRWLGP